MAQILPFKKPSARQKNQGNTLCKQGHHKWEVATERKFDVKQGKLVTVWLCKRCNKSKIKLL